MEPEASVAGRLRDFFQQTSKIHTSNKPLGIRQGGEVERDRLANLIRVAAGGGDGIEQAGGYAAGNQRSGRMKFSHDLCFA